MNLGNFEKFSLVPSDKNTFSNIFAFMKCIAPIFDTLTQKYCLISFRLDMDRKYLQIQF